MLDFPRRAFRKIGRRIQMARAAATADAFLASYPKSGRTWFRFILSHYFAQVTARSSDQADGTIDLFSMFGIVPNFDLDPARGVPAFRYQMQRPQLPLILVTHHHYKRSLFLGRPVIFMVRDPRDVMVSAFFHATRHKHRFSGTVDAFIADKGQGLPALINYLNGWAEGLQNRESAVLSYEELSRDTVGASARIIEFLGYTPAEEALRMAVAAADFGAMRELELQGGLPAHDYDRADTESLRMRRGRVGGFENYLNHAQIERIQEYCEKDLVPSAKKLMARTGMKLH
jgi:alcohol sulfotransferase